MDFSRIAASNDIVFLRLVNRWGNLHKEKSKKLN